MTPDLSGRVFGKLTITGPPGPEHGPLPPVPSGWWLGRCVCGREIVAPGEGFTSRRITSCGRRTPEDTAADLALLAAFQPPPRI